MGKPQTSPRRSGTRSRGAVEQFKHWIKLRENPWGLVPGQQSGAGAELRAGIRGKSRDLLPESGEEEEEEGAGRALLLSKLHNQS